MARAIDRFMALLPVVFAIVDGGLDQPPGLIFSFSAMGRKRRSCASMMRSRPVPSVGASSAPIETSRCRVASYDRIASVSRCNSCTMSSGVPAGANKPFQLSISTASKPSSATVGTPGKAAARLEFVTATGRKVLD